METDFTKPLHPLPPTPSNPNPNAQNNEYAKEINKCQVKYLECFIEVNILLLTAYNSIIMTY